MTASSHLLSRRTSRRGWRFPLTVGLAALAALPLGGFGALAWIQVGEEREAVREASEVERNTREVVKVIDLRFAFSEERIPTEATLLGPSMGIPLETISAVLGYDVQHELERTRRRTDELLDEVSSFMPTIEFRRALDSSRRASDAREPYDIDRLNGLIEDTTNVAIQQRFTTLERLIADLDGGGDAARSLLALQATFEAHRQSLGAIQDLAANLLPHSTVDRRQSLTERRARYQLNADTLHRVLPPDLLDDWQAIDRTGTTSAFVQAMNATIETGAPLSLAVPINELGEVFVGGIDRAQLLLDLLEGAADDVNETARRLATEASDRFGKTMAIMAFLLVFTVSGTYVLARSILAPLHHLGDRASRVRRGELDGTGSVAGGPRELSLVAEAFDEAVELLVRFEAQATALASGQVDGDAFDDPIPGRLGGVLNDSVDQIARSIRESELLRGRLLHQATHDALTGLPNRSAAMQRLTESLSGGDRVSVLFMDLDGFKRINDSHGHGVGDQFLVAIAHRLRDYVDTAFVARLGGDEFLVIATDLPDGDDLRLGDLLLEEVRRTTLVDGLALTAEGASIGVARSSRLLRDPIALMKAADIALYEAKARLRGPVVLFDDELAARNSERERIATELPAAIRSGQLVPWYQPVVDSVTGQLRSVEALVRWQHPQRGLLNPGAFMWVIESGDLMNAIDDTVLQRALEDAAGWANDPMLADVSVAVNVSRRQLLGPDFIERVHGRLRAGDVAPDRVIFEISEGVVSADLAASAGQLAALRDLGTQVALDDFGAGYTSLSHLRMPVDIVKVDQSIIRSLGSPREMTLLSTFADVASRIGLRTVAEGVEDASILELVRQVGCDLVQGYHFAKPMPLAELSSWALASRTRPANFTALRSG